MTTDRVVLDAGGQAPLLPAAREAILAAIDEGWADPRRLHSEGRRARALLDGARESLAAAVGARTEEVDLAPSHVAALHSAVSTVALGRRRVGADVVVSAVERAGFSSLGEGQRVGYELERNRRTGKEAAVNLRAE